jgi:UDP-N-acetylglucosamine diphosphorylase / glucose-1-phosphate thymidylyltransferase / UDP-N-acetylgalactosamine diphosphorylase / glucosamine-1-phosphate N-acetyltransferase / galactosamine-1-phosphate N-acetyltransferase
VYLSSGGKGIRGNVIVGDGCVVGHATEVKQSVLLNHAHAPHFAFIFPQEFMH